MDLIRIFHVVDMPSSGKHDFNHIYVVGLILSILIHFDTVLFESVHLDFLSPWCSSNVHVFGMVIVPRMLACVVLFLLYDFSDSRYCPAFSGHVWFPILCLAFTDDHGVD